MEYQVNLSWRQARALARAGAMVRPMPWTDRWLIWVGHFWFIRMTDGTTRKVQSVDFTNVEFDRTDWTTTWPDQYACHRPDDQPEPPDDQPEAGGPIMQNYAYHLASAPIFGMPPIVAYGLNVWGGRVLKNPFPVTAAVSISGVAADYLVFSTLPATPDYSKPLPRARHGGSGTYVGGEAGDQTYRGWEISLGFVLGGEASFWFGAEALSSGYVGYNLTVVFTP